MVFAALIALGNQPLQYVIPWIPSLNVEFALALDGLGYIFALIISGIGALVLLYAAGYFDTTEDFSRFSSYTLIFMSAMLGIVLSDNILLLFVFWELTSLTSYLLIGFKHENDAAREGARRALLITGGGGLAMLAGLILIGLEAGTFSLSAILTSGDALRESALYVPVVILVMIGAFTKSAQFPFHFWLPGAMEAPTPASAYLHSATMVKAGIFLLARLSPALGNTALWQLGLCTVGLITFLYGGLFALRQTDLKGILAYSTVSWLGVLVALIGLGTHEAQTALIVGILAHALYKGALFLTAGSIDHATDTRDISKLGKLAGVMRYSFVGALIACVSMAGIPPLFGFLGKETLKIAAVEFEGQTLSLIFTVAAVIGSALTVAVALRLLWDTFFGQKHDDSSGEHHPHEVTPLMWSAPLALGAFSLMLPFALPQVIDPLVNNAIEAITLEASDVHVHLFDGLTTPFILSMVAIALGAGILAIRRPLIGLLQRGREFNPNALYEWVFVRGLPDWSERFTARLQNGRLRDYISVVLAAFVGLMICLLIVGALNPINQPSLQAALAGLDFEVLVVCALLIVAAAASVIAPTRLAAIAALGIEGALVALLFALFGAPDLAFTQLMIEVVALVLFILAFHFLPDTFVTRPTRLRQVRDLAIAAGVGLTVMLLVLAAQDQRIGDSISPYYIANAVIVGQGHNVVNVILVDFRGMDTQGEILVLVIAAMGVVALLRLRPPGQPRGRRIEKDAVVSSKDEGEPVIALEAESQRGDVQTALEQD
jgi:multicomponent Na+:H+ antiporter subunit A